MIYMKAVSTYEQYGHNNYILGHLVWNYGNLVLYGTCFYGLIDLWSGFVSDLDLQGMWNINFIFIIIIIAIIFRRAGSNLVRNIKILMVQGLCYNVTSYILAYQTESWR